MHHHGPQYRTIFARRVLRAHPAVRAYGSTQHLEAARVLALSGEVNTIFVDPWAADRRGGLVPFIEEIRRERPRIVFVLYAEPEHRARLIESSERLAHYFVVDVPGEGANLSGNGHFDEVLRRCEEWHREQFEYDIALSFAGADRVAAQALAVALREVGASVFFDEFEEASLLGKDLFAHLHEIYSKRARYSVVLVSRAYAARAWTHHERRAIQERALLERGREYVLPVRLDDTPLPGLFSTTGYTSMSKGAVSVAGLIAQKLWMDDATRPKSLIGSDRPEYEGL